MLAKQLNWPLRQLPSIHRHSRISRPAILVDTNPRLPRWGQLYSSWTVYSLVDQVVLREQGDHLRLVHPLQVPALQAPLLQVPGLDLRLAVVLLLLVLVPRLLVRLRRPRAVLQVQVLVPVTIPALPLPLTVAAIH